MPTATSACFPVTERARVFHIELPRRHFLGAGAGLALATLLPGRSRAVGEAVTEYRLRLRSAEALVAGPGPSFPATPIWGYDGRACG